MLAGQQERAVAGPNVESIIRHLWKLAVSLEIGNNGPAMGDDDEGGGLGGRLSIPMAGVPVPEDDDDGFLSGVLKKTGSSVSASIGKAGHSIVGAGSSVVGAFRFVRGAVKRVF